MKYGNFTGIFNRISALTIATIFTLTSVASAAVPIFLTQTASAEPDKKSVFINEIMPNPSEGKEWIELYYAGDTSTPLNNWTLIDKADHKIEITGTNINKTHRFTVIEINNQILNNEGDTLSLYNSDGELVDSLTYETNFTNKKDSSYGRGPDGSANTQAFSSADTSREAPNYVASVEVKSITAKNFNTHSGKDYKGINVGFTLNGSFSNVTSVNVELYTNETENPIAVNTSNDKLLALINDGETNLSTPFVITEGTYKEQYWSLGAFTGTKEVKPAKAVITITDSGETYTTVAESLAVPNGWTYESLFPVDDQGPVATLVSPAINASIRGVSDVVMAYYDESGVQKSYFNIKDSNGNMVSIDGKSTFWMTENSDGNWFATIDTRKLKDGTYFFTTRPMDNLGNATYTKNLGPIKVDNSAPSTSNLVFSNYHNNNVGGQLKISLDITDPSGVNLNGQTYVRFAKDGKEYTYKFTHTGGDRYETVINTRDIVPANQFGIASVKFSLQDMNGNNRSWKPEQYRTIGIDNSGPGASLKSPLSNSIVAGEQTFTFDITDHTGVSGGYAKLVNKATGKGPQNNITENEDGTWSATFDTTKLTDGDYRVDIRPKDTFGTARYGSNKGTVTVDNSVPVLKTPVLFADGSVAEGSSVRGSQTILIQQEEDHPQEIYVEYMEKDSSGIWRKKTGKGFKATNEAQFTFDTARWNDGAHKIKITTWDIAKNRISYDFLLTADRIAPVFTAELSANIFHANGSSAELTGEVIDALSPIKNMNYAIWEKNTNGSKGAVVKNWTTLTPADGIYDEKTEELEATLELNKLPEGTYILGVRATDAAGNRANGGDFTFTIDNNKPTIEITAPTNSQVLNRSFDVVVVAEDNYNLNRIAVNVYDSSNGSFLRACGSTSANTPLGVTSYSFSCALSPDLLSNGTYVLKASASDLNDRVAVTTASITIDTTAPKAEVKPNSISHDGKVYSSISYKLFDNFKVKGFAVNGKFHALSPNQWSDANNITVGGWQGATYGSNTFTVYDLAGNEKSYEFILDNEKPTATITAANQVKNNLEFTGVVNDENFRHYYCWLTKKGVSGEVANTRGENCVTTWANDLKRNGNPSTPSNEGVGSADNPAFVGNFNIEGLESGDYIINLVAVDRATNQSEVAKFDVSIDLTSPVASVEVSEINSDKQLTVAGSAIESSIKSHWFEILHPDGSKTYESKMNTTENTHTFTLDTAILDDGEYRIRYVATDRAGNRSDDPSYSNPTLAYFTVDNTAPVLTLNDIENGTEKPIITGTVDDATATVKILVDDAEYDGVVETEQNEDGTYNWAATIAGPLADGDHPVVVTATDLAGNESEEQTGTLTVKTLDDTTLDRESTRETNEIDDDEQNPTIVTAFNTNNPDVLGVTNTDDTTDTDAPVEGEVESAAITSTDDADEAEKELVESTEASATWYWAIALVALLGAVFFGYRNFKSYNKNN